MDPKNSAVNGGPQSTADAEPDVTTGGEGGAQTPPARTPTRTATGPDQETIDKLIARGAKVARRDLNETVAKEFGKGLEDVLADYKERIARDAEKDAKVEGEKEKHQREIERERKAHLATSSKLESLVSKLKTAALDGRVKDVLAKLTPANETAAKLLAREARERMQIDLDDKGEIEVTYLDAGGKPADALNAEGLAAELSEALPMLVTQRTGHGAGLGVTVTTPPPAKTKRGQAPGQAPTNGSDEALRVGARTVPVYSSQENIAALGALLGQKEQ